MTLALATLLSWQGLFVSVEQTAMWNRPLKQPGITASAAAMVGLKKATIRVVYLQPLQKHGYGPAVQVGVSVRVF